MIKGAQHHIIEIHRTEDPYFERALLFVRPSYADRSEDMLRERGKRFLSKTDSYSTLRQNRALCWFKRCALLLTGGIGGVLIAVLSS